MTTMIRACALVALGLMVAGCSKSGAEANPAAFDDMIVQLPADSRVEESGGERRVFHNATPADAAYLKQTTAIVESRATMYVNGMGCPQCVSNVDIALERTGKVEAVQVDLGSGMVYAKFVDGKHPTPAELAKVVSDNGFTLVKIVPKV